MRASLAIDAPVIDDERRVLSIDENVFDDERDALFIERDALFIERDALSNDDGVHRLWNAWHDVRHG